MTHPHSPWLIEGTDPSDLLARARQLLDGADGDYSDGLKTVFTDHCSALEAAVNAETARRAALGARVARMLATLNTHPRQLDFLARSLGRWYTPQADKRAAAQVLREFSAGAFLPSDTLATRDSSERSPGLHAPFNGGHGLPARESIECHPMFVVSTANIERRDAQLLEQGCHESPMTNVAFIANTTYGFVLWIDDEGPGENNGEEAGYSRAFLQLLVRVHQECKRSCYLLLDSGGNSLLRIASL
jgi:hypothetical protein